MTCLLAAFLVCCLPHEQRLFFSYNSLICIEILHPLASFRIHRFPSVSPSSPSSPSTRYRIEIVHPFASLCISLPLFSSSVSPSLSTRHPIEINVVLPPTSRLRLSTSHLRLPRSTLNPVFTSPPFVGDFLHHGGITWRTFESQVLGPRTFA